MIVHCGSCSMNCLSTQKCNSCSNMVCCNCLTSSDVWCLACQEVFPVPPPTHAFVEPFRFDSLGIEPMPVGSEGQFDAQSSMGLASQTDLLSAFAVQNGIQRHARAPKIELESFIGAEKFAHAEMWRPPLVTDAERMSSLQNVLQTPLGKTGAAPAHGGAIKTDQPLMKEFIHTSNVPGMKGEKYEIEDDEARTLMVCNLPCRLGYDEFVEAIHGKGFRDCVEFVYLPCRSGQPSSNLGYGFASFVTISDAKRFAAEFEGYRFSRRGGSQKVCEVKSATFQGFNGKFRHCSRNYWFQ